MAAAERSETVSRPAWEPKPAHLARARIVEALAKAGGYVSGEELGAALGAGRNAVWKQVQRLRAVGYQIEGTSRKGYRLLSVPDTPFPWAVTSGLRTRELGRTVVYEPVTPSTNDLARMLARQGAPHGLLVVADAQTAGRGRRGNAWVSPPGAGLWFSLVLRPRLTPQDAPCLALVVAVAVAQAITVVTGLPARVKWPNDVVLADRKVSGVLVEMSAEAELIHHLIVGVGVNVDLDPADFPPDLQQSATSLSAASGRPVARVRLLQEILLQWENRYHRYLQQGAGPGLAEARALSATLGRTVRILSDGETAVEGMATAIGEDGALWVRDAFGVERAFYAGEVSVRSAGES
jgi:BirA family biotin operon repressor/biotin-[acetyl-CoA-carboxylase] ligase